MPISHTVTEKEKKGLSHKTPFYAYIKERFILNKSGSSKKTLHVVLDLKDSDIEYQVGSCFGILPENSPERVQTFLEIFETHPETPVTYKKTGETMTIESFLTKHANLDSLNSNFLKLVNHPALATKESLKAFTHEHDPLSFLETFYTSNVPLQEWCDAFQPLLPRYYSIASSQKKVGDEVHFMVATFEYEHAGQTKQGVTSSHLISSDTTIVPIFLQHNPRFTLPEDPNTPIIMIGPGTGVAPFIGFIQERAHTKAPGKNWLFFGERNKKGDFYYEEFLTEVAIQGILKLDLAFSRDQEEKIYVQHKMLAKGAELWQWISEEGANIYICGDAKQMAKDVTEALLTIFETHGKMDRAAAEEYLTKMRKTHQIHLDVY